MQSIKPLMQPRQLRLMEQELLARGKAAADGVMDVLEWGAGNSTAYFTRLLRDNGIAYRWTSVEHDRGWYEKVRADLADDLNVDVRWVDTGADAANWRSIPMDDYVNLPATLGRQFDFIFVDGRKRRRCLLKAKELLKPGGVVILHDAQRRYYFCAQDTYADSRFLERGLWRGTEKRVSSYQRLLNGLNRFYYRNIAKTVESLIRAKALKRALGINVS